MLCITISGQEVSRQPAPVCGEYCGGASVCGLGAASAGESAINAQRLPSSASRARSGCSASPSADKRSAAYLRPSVVNTPFELVSVKTTSARLHPSAAQCIRLRSAALPKEAPSMPVLRPPAASVRALMLCVAISGQEVSRPSAPVCGSTLRLSVSVCGLRSAALPKEAPSMPGLRPPAASVRAQMLLHHHQRARGQPPICARLRVNSAAQCIRLRSCAPCSLEEAPSMPS